MGKDDPLKELNGVQETLREHIHDLWFASRETTKEPGSWLSDKIKGATTDIKGLSRGACTRIYRGEVVANMEQLEGIAKGLRREPADLLTAKRIGSRPHAAHFLTEGLRLDCIAWLSDGGSACSLLGVSARELNNEIFVGATHCGLIGKPLNLVDVQFTSLVSHDTSHIKVHIVSTDAEFCAALPPRVVRSFQNVMIFDSMAQSLASMSYGDYILLVIDGEPIGPSNPYSDAVIESRRITGRVLPVLYVGSDNAGLGLSPIKYSSLDRFFVPKNPDAIALQLWQLLFGANHNDKESNGISRYVT